MTRINASIRPAELSNSMLFAEYREAKRIPNKLKENGTELCKCNNYERLLIDENPQINAKKYDIKGIKVYSMEYINDCENSFWACPYCKTDAYLTDTV